MKQQEFIDKVKGLPWVNRASSFESCDCYGLIDLYFKHVLNIILPTVDGYTENECDTAQGWQANIHDWEEVPAACENGLLFTCYKGDQPTHVGVTLNSTTVLHARGSKEHPGRVEIHSIRTLARIHGKVTFHKYKGKSCQS